mmetsp:Transcript_7793/g.18784  ORF Transcript_7793/g.18784 Transcript_7793/m.18784 type:complete len:345 (+) Transcript_7793:122-1156(+)|eukprot:CAMPEP_0113615480 /NCGR_PEP_ID=MMETSP0017_2-20120614/7720_1 /TAXON_ID=2856 /ORGANISM="Cylindrotheca closterium" /LENGTH=344 /DNA_ID=CAMNT_0000524713 /DNA_START=158 /DNA_END=1192 /DNA_ORIENTATION=- /assembly_acc=CAM_ASM_000147
MQFKITSALSVLLLVPSLTFGFSNSLSQVSRSSQSLAPKSLHILQSTKDAETEAKVLTKEEITENLYFPLTFDDMVKQTSATMQEAYEKGMTRQTIRILLPRSTDSENLLQYYENDAENEMGDTVLVPPDETWQGGIMQLYRACSYSCQEILRRFSRNGVGGVVPRLQEDRSIDESGVDGIGLWLTQGASPEDDVSCFVQPSQETVSAIESISQQAGSRLVTLMNPQWRITDDALDTASRSEGAWGTLASFLGGKGGSLRKLEELGFTNVFVMEGYVCRGGNTRMMKRFDSNWAVFAENDAGTEFIKVGTSESRPTYQDIDAMLEEKGVALKYARDIGLAPKLE